MQPMQKKTGGRMKISRLVYQLEKDQKAPEFDNSKKFKNSPQRCEI